MRVHLPPFALWLYRALLILLSALMLGFYLACLTSGVIRLCFYDDLGGLGLMAVGVLLFGAARLALGALREAGAAAQGQVG